MMRIRRAVAIAVLILMAAGAGTIILGDRAAAQTMTGLYAAQIGERFPCVAGENLTQGAAVAIKTSDGKCYLASRTDATIRPAVGFVLRAWASGATVQVVTRGLLDGITGGTAGKQVFLATAGGITTEAYGGMSPWQVLGQLITNTRMRLEITPLVPYPN